MERGFQCGKADICHQGSRSWFYWGLGCIFWSFYNLLTDVFLPWYWQSSLQGIWIILVCVKLIRFSVVSSLWAFSYHIGFPDKRNDIHDLLDGFNHTMICGLAGFNMHNSSLTMTPAFCQASHMKLSLISCSYPLYSTYSKKMLILYFPWLI